MTDFRIATSVSLLSCISLACSSNDSAPGPSTPGSSGTSQTASGTQAGSGGNGGAANDASMGSGGSGGQMDSGTPEANSTRDGALCGNATCPAGAFCSDGACTCPSYKPGVCEDGCTDLTSNPDHCGSCVIKCAPGAACNNGTCGTAPSTVVPSAPGCDVLNLALTGDRLYWTDRGHGTVKSLSTSGTEATPASLATMQKAPRSLLIAGSVAYWINGGDNTVMKAALADAGAPAPIVTVMPSMAEDSIGAIAVSGATLYYAALDKIYKTTITGGAATLVGIAQQGGVVSALAFDAMNLYYPTKLHNDVEIMSLLPSPDGGSQTSRIAESQGGLYFDNITVIGNQAYWANNEALRRGFTNRGLNTTTVASTANFGVVSGFVIGTTHAYIGEGSDGAQLGFVEKAPLDVDAAPPDGIAQVIARDQKAPNSLALDATKVYWSTRDVGSDAGGASGCTIMSHAQ